MLASVVNRGTPSPLVLWTFDRGGARPRPGPRVARSRPRPRPGVNQTSKNILARS